MTNEEKRLLLKKLKEQKTFTKFCFAVADTFACGIRPKETREAYLSFVAKEENINGIVKSVKEWKMKPNKIIIQP